MATKTLVIDGTDPKHFLITLEAGTLKIGDCPTHVEGVVRDLRVLRVRCEIEVEDDRDHVPVDEPGVIAPQALRPGSPVRLSHAQLSLLTPHPPLSPTPAPTATESVAPTATGPRRLKVIDGGDQGRAFRLLNAGTMTIGKAGGPADIGLHDFYVARLHCSLDLKDGAVLVTHIDGSHGTLIDGLKIPCPQQLRPGSVLRVGNSHLRLEVGPFTDDATRSDVGSDGSGTHKAVSPSKSGVLRATAVDEGAGVLRAPPVAPKPAPRSTDPLAQLEGQPFGNYRAGALLARGFTSAVLRATDVRTEHAAVLKVFPPEFPATSAELERFAQAIKSVQHVRHPNLVTVLGAGRTGSHCWIAREYIEGESAAAVIARIAGGDKPSWTRAARVVVHLARVLDCLHGHKLVHGNITPHNVLLRAHDHATLLGDLRLAQALEGSQLQRGVLEKKLLAELPFLAPEQAEPGAFVDDLADLYAVGAVAYALITGRPPVTGDSPAEILDKIQAGRVARPSAFYKRVPAPFDAVVMKLLATHQEDRYPTAEALLRDMAPLAQEHDLKI